MNETDNPCVEHFNVVVILCTNMGFLIFNDIGRVSLFISVYSKNVDELLVLSLHVLPTI